MVVNEEIIAEINNLQITEKEKALMKEILNFEENKNISRKPGTGQIRTIGTRFRDQYKNYFTKFVEEDEKEATDEKEDEGEADDSDKQEEYSG